MTDLVGVGLPAEITKHEQEKKLWAEQCATMSHAAVLDMISSLNASIALTRSETNRIQEHESGFKSTELKKVHRTQIKRREQKLSYCIHYLIKRISHDEKDASDFDKCVVEMSQEYSALKYDLQRLRSLENPNGFGSGREEDQMASLQARIDDCIMNVTGFKQEDAIGCDEAIKMIHTAIMSARFPQLGQAPLTRMLLYGPPGVGKTHVVKVIASMFKLTMLSITPSAVMSKWQGDSAKLIRLVFSTAIRLAPSLVFIDELDGIARESGEDHRSGEEYNQNKSALLVGFNELDAYNKKTDSNGNLVNQNKQVFFIGATNHRKNLIGALHRRLERHIELKAPDAEARAKMFKHFLGDAAPHITDEECRQLATLEWETNEKVSGLEHKLRRTMAGYTGADIDSICKDVRFAQIKGALMWVDDELPHYVFCGDERGADLVINQVEYDPEQWRIVGVDADGKKTITERKLTDITEYAVNDGKCTPHAHNQTPIRGTITFDVKTSTYTEAHRLQLSDFGAYDGKTSNYELIDMDEFVNDAHYRRKVHRATHFHQVGDKYRISDDTTGVRLSHYLFERRFVQPREMSFEEILIIAKKSKRSTEDGESDGNVVPTVPEAITQARTLEQSASPARRLFRRRRRKT